LIVSHLFGHLHGRVLRRSPAKKGTRGMLKVGPQLREYRERLGYTLKDLSNLTKISISYLSEIERGVKEPSLQALSKICSTLRIPREEMMQAAVYRDEYYLTLGDKIRVRRQELGLTITELSKRVGLSVTYLSDIERNVTQPSVEALRAIASGLELPVALLIQHGQNSLGRKLLEVRKELGLTQRELAARAGVSVAFIGQLEKGKVKPSLKSVEKLAEALGISPCYLIMEKDGLEDMVAAMGPDLKRLLMEPQVQAVLRQICTMNEKELRFVINFIENFKRAGFH